MPFFSSFPFPRSYFLLFTIHFSLLRETRTHLPNSHNLYSVCFITVPPPPVPPPSPPLPSLPLFPIPIYRLISSKDKTSYSVFLNHVLLFFELSFSLLQYYFLFLFLFLKKKQLSYMWLTKRVRRRILQYHPCWTSMLG